MCQTLVSKQKETLFTKNKIYNVEETIIWPEEEITVVINDLDWHHGLNKETLSECFEEIK